MMDVAAVALSKSYGSLKAISSRDPRGRRGHDAHDARHHRPEEHPQSRRHALCHVPLRDAPETRWATVNPCDAIDLPARIESDEIRFLTSDEVEALASRAVAAVRHRARARPRAQWDLRYHPRVERR